MPKDLELLGMLRLINTRIPQFVLQLTEEMPNGEFPSDVLLDVASVFHEVGDRLVARATETAPRSGQGAPMVIDSGVAAVQEPDQDLGARAESLRAGADLWHPGWSPGEGA